VRAAWYYYGNISFAFPLPLGDTIEQREKYHSNNSGFVKDINPE
jgi:hypothetical protein